eukprot:2072464-Amphidinium_carterae.1
MSHPPTGTPLPNLNLNLRGALPPQITHRQGGVDQQLLNDFRLRVDQPPCLFWERVYNYSAK